MRARIERKPGSIGRDEGLQTYMLCLTMMSCTYLDWSIEIIRANMSRVICMPNN
jgi:hypothetical protein